MKIDSGFKQLLSGEYKKKEVRVQFGVEHRMEWSRAIEFLKQQYGEDYLKQVGVAEKGNKFIKSVTEI